MSHIDTLKMYKQHLEAGYSEEMALEAVYSLNNSFDGVATKSDINNAVKDLEYDMNLKFLQVDSQFKQIMGRLSYMSWAGVAMFSAIVVPVFSKILGN